jgi:hypothetical protein
MTVEVWRGRSHKRWPDQRGGKEMVVGKIKPHGSCFVSAEGLSLSIIEAVTHGVPVTSRIAAHKELMGTADYLFDPYDIKSITEAVLKHRRNRKNIQKAEKKTLSTQT